MTVKDIYEIGDYSLVVKLEYHDVDVGKLALKIAEETKKREGEEMTLGDLVAWLESLSRPVDVRVTTSFAPVDWFSPASWGQYSWPYKTLAKYGLDKTKGYYHVVPGRVIDKALLGLYKGFGIALLEKGLEALGREGYIEEKAVPLAVFLDARREPRRKAILVVEHTEKGYTGYALTSMPEIASLLEQNGFEARKEVEPLPGFRVYKLNMEKTFVSPSEFNLFLKELKDLLFKHGYILYLHDMAGLAKGLPEEVYEKVAV